MELQLRAGLKKIKSTNEDYRRPLSQCKIEAEWPCVHACVCARARLFNGERRVLRIITNIYTVLLCSNHILLTGKAETLAI